MDDNAEGGAGQEEQAFQVSVSDTATVSEAVGVQVWQSADIANVTPAMLAYWLQRDFLLNALSAALTNPDGAPPALRHWSHPEIEVIQRDDLLIVLRMVRLTWESGTLGQGPAMMKECTRITLAQWNTTATRIYWGDTAPDGFAAQLADWLLRRYEVKATQVTQAAYLPPEPRGSNFGTAEKVREAHRLRRAGEGWEKVKKVCAYETYTRWCYEVTGEEPR